jgi:hypothetical protein
MSEFPSLESMVLQKSDQKGLDVEDSTIKLVGRTSSHCSQEIKAPHPLQVRIDVDRHQLKKSHPWRCSASLFPNWTDK